MTKPRPTAARQRPTAQMWAIAGEVGLYTHTFFTRREAIKHHTEALGKTWAYCRAKGDYTTRVTVPYTLPSRRGKNKTRGRK